MRDPLQGFDWLTLYEQYDSKCKGFQPCSSHLEVVRPHVGTDRALYNCLVGRTQSRGGAAWAVTIGDYEAMLYWKLYSNHQALGNLRRWLGANQDDRARLSGSLERLLKELPTSIERNLAEILNLIRVVGRHELLGMKSPTALPVRTAFLHFFYPKVVPIFDRMVLGAVGVSQEGANHKLDVLTEYIPFAWQLADQHTKQLTGFPETPVRLVDMALWVARGGEPCRLTCSPQRAAARA